MQDESDGDMESLDGNKLENVLVALKVRRAAEVLSYGHAYLTDPDDWFAPSLTK